jgi:hypothetical protein
MPARAANRPLTSILGGLGIESSTSIHHLDHAAQRFGVKIAINANAATVPKLNEDRTSAPWPLRNRALVAVAFFSRRRTARRRRHDLDRNQGRCLVTKPSLPGKPTPSEQCPPDSPWRRAVAETSP